MSVCTLHVGTHKTGSTAIQVFLRARSLDLLDRGVLVPRAGSSAQGSHLPLVRALCGEDTNGGASNTLAALAEELSAHPDRDLVLSSESLEQHFQPHEPSEVAAFFRARGYRVRLICFVRPQPARMNASYAQVVQAFRKNPDFRSYVQATLARANLAYSRWLRIASEQSLDLIALPYNETTRQAGVLGPFLRALGLEDMTPQSSAHRENVTLGAAGIAAARTCMDRLAAQGLELTHSQEVRCKRALVEAGHEHPSPSFCALGPGLTRRIEDRYWGDNQYFARVAWGSDWAEMFPVTADPPRRNEVDRDEAGSPLHDVYQAILDRVWPAVLRIAEDPSPEQHDGEER